MVDKNGADNKVIILYNIIGGAMKKDAGNGATRSPVWIINKLCVLFSAALSEVHRTSFTYFSSPAPVSSSYCES